MREDKKRAMNQFLLYFRFEPYLAQWYIHEMGGTSPVELPRGSVESDILRLFLTKRPDDVPVDTGQDANLAIVIPAFKEKEDTITWMLQQSIACTAASVPALTCNCGRTSTRFILG